MDIHVKHHAYSSVASTFELRYIGVTYYARIIEREREREGDGWMDRYGGEMNGFVHRSLTPTQT